MADMDISIRGELWDNDSAEILRWFGWKDITCPMDIQVALEKAAGDAVTVLINSPGGDMTVGGEIRSMLRRYSGHTTALFQGYGASAATMAAAGCNEIVSEPGALLCYHNPSCTATGDYREMGRAERSIKNARDGILDIYLSRPGCKASREELATLMGKDIYITPRQAMALGLIDRMTGQIADDNGDSDVDVNTLVAAVGGRRILLTDDMRQLYQDHLTHQREREAIQARTNDILDHIRKSLEY